MAITLNERRSPHHAETIKTRSLIPTQNCDPFSFGEDNLRDLGDLDEVIMKRRWIIPTTVLLWLLVVSVHGYWRLFREYRYGNLLVFATQSLPLWALVLAAALMLEYYYCGDE